MITEHERTRDEDRAIRALQKLARTWPKSLWLFAASGRIHVMQKANGDRVYRKQNGRDVPGSHDYVDPACSIATIAIESDGGDW